MRAVTDEQVRGPGRPRATTRAQMEITAIGLFLRHGYEPVPVEQIAAACGVGRATFFRYFASKADVIFFAFEAYLDTMRESLDAAGARKPVGQAVSDCIVDSTRQALENPSWLDRFVLLDTAPGLRAGTAEHWQKWAVIVRTYLDERLGQPQTSTDLVRRAAFTAAVRDTYIEMLRRPENDQADPQRFVDELEAELRPLCRSLTRALHLS